MDEYRFDICEQCAWRDGSMGFCDVCDEGDFWEEDWEADGADAKRKVIPILEAA